MPPPLSRASTSSRVIQLKSPGIECFRALAATPQSSPFCTSPSSNRVNEMIATLQAYYADRGFPKAVILPRIEEEEPAPERVELVLSITAGNRVTIGAARVTGAPLEPASGILAELNLEAGRPYDRPAIDARVSEYEESLRERGYYEARVRPAAAGRPGGVIPRSTRARCANRPGRS